MWPFKAKEPVAVPEQSDGEKAMVRWDALDSRVDSNIQTKIKIDRKECTYSHTCKPEDDVFHESIKQCRASLAEKQTQIDWERKILEQEILEMLSKFPLNLPCTSDTIATKLDLTKSVVKSLLVDVRQFPIFTHDPNYRDAISEYITRHLGVDATNWKNIYELDPDQVIIDNWIVTVDMGYGECKLRSTKHPNWRFVASRKVTYLERIA